MENPYQWSARKIIADLVRECLESHLTEDTWTPVAEGQMLRPTVAQLAAVESYVCQMMERGAVFCGGGSRMHAIHQQLRLSLLEPRPVFPRTLAHSISSEFT